MLEGTLRAIDPRGRFGAFEAGGVLSVRALDDGELRWTCPPGDLVVVGPHGDRVVAWSDGDLALRSADGPDRRVSAPRPEWMTFDGDGDGVYLGEVAEGARVVLRDADTLEVVGAIEPTDPVYGEPSDDWGEGATVAAGTQTVAFAATAGDSTTACGVAVRSPGGLTLRGGAPDMPGERVMGIAHAGQDVYIVDSDEIVSRWNTADGTTTTLASGYRLLQPGSAPPGLAALAARNDSDAWARVFLNGPVVSDSRRLWITVEQERTRNGRLGWITSAFVLLDRDSGEALGWVDAPDPTARLIAGPRVLVEEPGGVRAYDVV